MVYWLTKDVAWGDYRDLANVPPVFKCVLGVGRNLADIAGCSAWTIPEKTPYFSVAWPDSEEPPGEYVSLLLDQLELVIKHKLLPILVHCRAGQMRSPAVAILTAVLVSSRGDRLLTPDELLQAAKNLRGDVMHNKDGEIMPYCRKIWSQSWWTYNCEND